MKKIKFRLVPFVVVFVISSILSVYLLRDRIVENKFARAKMDILETMIKEKPENKKEKILEIIDSTFFNQDSTDSE